MSAIDLRRAGLSRNRDAIYFIAPRRTGGWRVVKVLEHGPYHDERPASWRGPYATSYEAQAAAASSNRTAKRCSSCGGTLRPAERIDGPALQGECSCWQTKR